MIGPHLPQITAFVQRHAQLAGQSSTVTSWSTNYLIVILALWAGAKSWCKMKSASPWSLSVDRNIKHFPVDGCIYFGSHYMKKHSRSTPADDMTPQIIPVWKLYTGLPAPWILCHFALPQVSTTLILKEKRKFTFQLKRGINLNLIWNIIIIRNVFIYNL